MRTVEIRPHEIQGAGRRKRAGVPFLAPPIIHPPLLSAPHTFFAPAVLGGALLIEPLHLRRLPGDDPLGENGGRRKWAHFETLYAAPWIFPSAIPTPRQFYSPDVAGPITTAAAIPSPQQFYSPTLNVEQVLSPASIPSPSGFFAPRAANVQTISPAVITSPSSFFTPVISGSPQFVSLIGVSSPRQFHTPTVNGGEGGVFVFLSGVDVTQYLSQVAATCKVTSQTIGRWQATFDLFDGSDTFVPVLGQTILITDFGRRIFAGCITQIVTDRFLSSLHNVTYHCTAVDKSGICDHRIVTGKTYAAADWADAGQVVLDLVSNYLDGEGITTGGVPAVMGPLGSDLPFNFDSVKQAFDTIATLTGTVWWIDTDCVLYFSSLTDLPAAPISLSETSQNWRASATGGASNIGGGLTTTQTTTNYLNKIYVVSNLNVVPGSNAGGSSGGSPGGYTETFTLHPGNPGILPTLDPSGRPVGFQTSIAIGSVSSMTVNGEAQTVYDFVNNYQGQTRVDGGDYLWVFSASNNQVNWTYEPPDNAVIVITYVPWSATSASLAQYGSALDPLDPHGDPLGTCGSGLYEGVVQVQNINNQDDLNAIALAELNRLGGIPFIVDFQTDHPGLRPGQLISVDVPLSGCPAKHLLITQATGTYIPPDLGQGLQSSFRWDLEATSNLDPGNWINWYERIIARTQNPLPVLQQDIYTFILGSGSNVAAGASITNPNQVTRTGLLVRITIAASAPPIGESLVVNITRNNTPIASIVMPATTSPNQLVSLTVSSANQIYLFLDDVLNVNVSYQVSGTNPVPASNVTLKIYLSV